MTITTTAILLLALAGADGTKIVLDRPVPDRLTGGPFRAELDRPVSASWSNLDLRSILTRIAETRRVAILLDRRIDSTQKLAVDLNGETLHEGLATITERVGGRLSVVGSTAFIGPAESASKLRTLVRIRSDELSALSKTVPGRRLVELSRSSTCHWNDLDRPADLIRRIAGRYGLDVVDLDRVPHDLWAGATLPAASPAEALSLVLIQFDLTFQWSDRADAVRIVPVPKEVAIERSYAPVRMRPANALEKIKEVIAAEGRVEFRGGRIRVRGTVEEHESVAALLYPDRRRSARAKPVRPVPIERRRFTLRIRRVPASAVMQKLEQSGIVFKYDAAALAAAGTDLNRPVTMDVEDATPEEFFGAIFNPLGLKFNVEGLTVTLTPKAD